MKPFLIPLLLILLGFSACSTKNSAEAEEKTVNSKLNPKVMKSYVAILEIPANDLPRAIAFYESILDIKIEVMEFDGIEMGVVLLPMPTIQIHLGYRLSTSINVSTWGYRLSTSINVSTT